MLLAIDTSTAVASVALYEGAGGAAGRVRAELTWEAGQEHTRQLLPTVRTLLARLGARPADLTGVGVALGPGSFNGLRVGLATAKLLALGLRIPLVGANTLEVTACQQREVSALGRWLVRPLYDAGRGQVATALYSWAAGADGEPVEVEAPRLAELGDALARGAALGEPTLLCGELRPEWVAAAAATGRRWLAVATGAGALRRAGYLAELAWRRQQAERVDDPATLQPLYLRRPPVLERAAAPVGELGAPAASKPG